MIFEANLSFKNRKHSLVSDRCVDIPSSISSRLLRTHCVGSLHLSASETCRLAFSRIFLSLLLEYIGFCCCQNSVLVSRYSSPWIARVRIALLVTDWLLADSSQNNQLYDLFIYQFIHPSAVRPSVCPSKNKTSSAWAVILSWLQNGYSCPCWWFWGFRPVK